MADYTRRLLLDNLVFMEGPRWHQGRLWFSDMKPGSALGRLPDGRLLVLSMTDGKPLSRWS